MVQPGVFRCVVRGAPGGGCEVDSRRRPELIAASGTGRDPWPWSEGLTAPERDQGVTAGSWTVLAGDARETLAAQPAGWARAMFADPPGAIDLQGNDWDEGVETPAEAKVWIELHASILRAGLRACAPGAPGGVWAYSSTSDYTMQACRRAGWRIEGKYYIINSQGTPKRPRDPAGCCDEWIRVRAPGAPIGPVLGRPRARNVAFLHDPECAEACALACAVDKLVRHAGVRKSGSRKAAKRGGTAYGGWGAFGGGNDCAIEGSEGTADRFFPCFRYEPKARGALRDAFLPEGIENGNPAAKPPPLGAWFAGLMTAPGDAVLDLYAGWGGISVGALLAGRRVVAAERDPRSAEMIAARLRAAAQAAGAAA